MNFKCPVDSYPLTQSKFVPHAYKSKGRSALAQLTCQSCGYAYIQESNNTPLRLDSNWADHRALYRRFLSGGKPLSPREVEVIRAKHFPHMSKRAFQKSMRAAEDLIPNVAPEEASSEQNTLPF